MHKLLCLLVLLATFDITTAPPPSYAPGQLMKKKDAPHAAGKVQLYQASDGWRFRVLDADGKLIAIGVQGYSNKDECTAAAELLIASVAKAKIIEQKKKDEKKKDEKK